MVQHASRWVVRGFLVMAILFLAAQRGYSVPRVLVALVWAALLPLAWRAVLSRVDRRDPVGWLLIGLSGLVLLVTFVWGVRQLLFGG